MSNYIKKILISLFFIITVIAFSPVIKAVEKVVLTDSNGKAITYYGTDEKVLINANYVMDDTDFRAVWVSPLVSDISYYSNKLQYQNQMVTVLEKMEEYGLNALVFHIRIMNDALYESQYCNWSEYYNTDPDWDCLPWLIEECHKRGIEFHAWMNPYRVANGTHDLNSLAKKFPTNNMASNPANLLQGKNSVILNPGIPLVRDWLVNVCMEVVEKYDVDAIHFDDYFYDAGVDDTSTRLVYNPNNLGLGNWRRLQVDTFINNLSKAIREYNVENKRRVQLGISPSGVYRADTNKSNGYGEVNYDPVTKIVSSDGSRTATASFQHYDNYLYSDTLKWINEEWIDYIIPQTYWAIDNQSCPYADLMDWWSKVCSYKNVNLYSGLGIYRTSSATDGWKDPKETYKEVMICNTFDNVHGVCFFKYSNIASAVNSPSVTPGMKDIWATPAILPEVRTMDLIKLQEPTNLKIEKVSNGNKISFDRDSEAKFYCIYRSETPITSFDPELVIDVIGDLSVNDVVSYVDLNASSDKNYYYGVRKQSYSNTLSDGVSASTVDAKAGEMLTLGEIETLQFTDHIKAGASAKVLFDKITYPYGGEIKYTISISFDNNEPIVAPKVNQLNGLYVVDFVVPVGTNSVSATLVAENNVGKSHKTISVELGDYLPDITNFMIESELYNRERATFVWNKIDDSNITYTIQSSHDGMIWNDIETLEGDKYKDINIRKEIKILGKGDIYYRVVAKKDNLLGFSNSIKTTIKGYLGDFKNLKINNKLPKEYYVLEEDDKLVITWDVHSGVDGDATYVNSYSKDFVNWLSLKAYSNVTCTVSQSGKVTLTIPISYQAFKIYVKITGISGTYESISDIYEIYVTMLDLFSDEIASYMITENNANIAKMGIFK